MFCLDLSSMDFEMVEIEPRVDELVCLGNSMSGKVNEENSSHLRIRGEYYVSCRLDGEL